MSDAKMVGEKLVGLCKQGKNMEAVETLYADDVMSIEAVAGQDMPREFKGKEAVLGKSQWWYDNHEVHSAEAKGPFPHGDDKFAVIFNMDVTFKPESQRMQMEEIGVYEVKGGKVVKEEFFYNMG